jgi:hypothetical protein
MSVERFSRYLVACRKQLSSGKVLARRYGQFRSMKLLECVDADGMPIPWYTYPAIEYLSHLDFSKLAIFEYGSGNSTLWWAKRALSVTSVENDENWYAKIQATMNHTLVDDRRPFCMLEHDRGSYINSLSKPHDVVVVDGRFRKECVEHLLSSNVASHVSMLIFDNSDWYPQAVQIMRDRPGWFEVDFHGFGPINRYTWTTSVFVNSEKRHLLKYSKSLRSVAGLAKNAESQ